jgi:hypothetical protein
MRTFFVADSVSNGGKGGLVFSVGLILEKDMRERTDCNRDSLPPFA